MILFIIHIASGNFWGQTAQVANSISTRSSSVSFSPENKFSSTARSDPLWQILMAILRNTEEKLVKARD